MLRLEQSEEARELLLAIGEGASKLSAQDEAIRECADGPEGQLVVDVVDDCCPGDAVAAGGGDAMAVIPVHEGAAELAVAEVVVPFKLGDLRLPPGADG